MKSQRRTQCLSNTQGDIENGVTSQTQNQLHSDINTAKISASNLSKLEIISNEHGSQESNPHNKSRTCIIIILNFFQK